MSGPLVSVLINNYNYAPFLEEAIESALSQGYENKEVVVVDDGSTDRSRNVIESFGSRVVPVFKVNGGQASAFNEGFAVSKGDIICFLDADDVMLPGKLESVVETMVSHPAIGWLFHPLQHVDTAAVSTSIAEARQKASANDAALHGSELDWRERAKRGTLPYFPTATSGMCFRRSLLSTILPMPEAIRITSDNYLKYAAAAMEPGYMATDPLAILRRHGSNAYTGRKDISASKAEIVMRIAYWLSQEFPDLQRLADREFAYGMGVFRSFGTNDTPDNLIQRYLGRMSPSRRLMLVAKSSYPAMTIRRLVRPIRHPEQEL